MRPIAPSVQFSAFTLNFPKGKTQITLDNKTGQNVIFSDWSLIRTTVAPYRAALLDNKGNKVAEYPVKSVPLPGGRLNYVIESLDPVGAQG